MKFIYKSKKFDSIIHIIIFILLSIMFIAVGCMDFSWKYFLILGIIYYIILRKLWIDTIIFEEKIVINRPFNFSKQKEEIDISACFLFNYEGGPGENNSYKLYYREKGERKKYKSIAISVWDWEDKKMLEGFFKEKGLKINEGYPKF